MASGETFQLAHRAFCNDDAATLRNLLGQHPELRARINDPQNDFGSPPVVNAKSQAMLDLLLEFGADINARSKWWAGGFGILHSAPPEIARYAIERGAQVDIHAAARLGLFDRVRELLATDPSLVHARGGDGQTPLHFASTEQIAAAASSLSAAATHMAGLVGGFKLETATGETPIPHPPAGGETPNAIRSPAFQPA